MRFLINSTWFCFKWGLALALLAALVAAPFVYQRVDEELRSQIEQKIGEQYPRLVVKVRHAQLVEGQGIEVRGLSILDPDATGPQAELAYLDELFLTCKTSLQELIKGKPEVTQVRIRRPVWRATRAVDGSWSITKLLPLPKFSDNPPTGDIENGTLEILDPTRSPASTCIVRDMNFHFAPEVADQGLSPFAQSAEQKGTVPLASAQSSTEPGAFPRSANETAAPKMRITGAMAAAHLQRCEVSALADPATGEFTLDGAATGLDLSPELRGTLPSELADRLSQLGSLRGEGNLTFHFQRQSEASPWIFRVDGEMTRGRIDDPRLPYTFNELHGKGHCDNNGFVLEDVSARNGQTSLRLSCRRDGFEPNSPMVLEASGNHLRLDQQLVGVLPDSLRVDWYKFLPDGEIDADVKLSYDGQAWTPEVTVKCLSVSFTCNKFPYRLEQGSGTIALKKNVLTAHLTAYSGSQPVRIDAELKNPGKQFTGSIEIEADNIPLEEKLYVALPGKGGAVVRSMNPRGTVNVYGRQWRDEGAGPEIHTHAMVALNRCSLSYEKFAYPLSNVRGRLELLDGQWTFKDLEGVNDTGVVTCRGHFGPTANGDELRLWFTGQNIPFEEELRDALQPGMQRLWTSLRPRGMFDFTNELVYTSADRKISVDLIVEPRGDSASIEPVYFPYRLDRLRGKLHYRDGHADLTGLQAVHGRTLVSSAGSCDLTPDGGWRFQLKNLTVDRLLADRELTTALPEGLRRGVAELKPTGAVNLRGTIDFARGGEPEAPLKTQWDVSLDLHQVGVNSGVKLENIHGGVRLVGSAEGDRFSSRGDLALDAVDYRGYQFTQVLGPLWIDNTRVLFGAWAEPKTAQKLPRRVTAKIYGGTLLADCQVTLSNPAQFLVHATLAEADLGQFAQENLPGRQQLGGKVVANVEFQGNSRGTHTLSGAGTVRLHDANIYELPLMVALLKILSVKQPDATAFTKSDIDFRIQGDHLLFDRINFNGDAVSLVGQGQLGLDSQIDLAFHAVVGRDELQIPVLHNIVGEASNQIMQIKVEGTLEHPTTRREAFPMMNQALQQLQADLSGNRRDAAPANSGPARILAPRR